MKPTHKCKICGTLWRLLPEGIWNLCSETCGKCCDNEPMGDQIAQLCPDCNGGGMIRVTDSVGSTMVLPCGACGATGVLANTQDEGSKPSTNAATMEKLALCKAAISHVICAIADSPRKYWLMGNGTGSWEKLTTAAAALWDKPVDKIRADFQPLEHEYRRYCEQLKNDEKLLEYCRENGITGKHE